MKPIDTSKTNWDFSTLFKNDDDPQLDVERKMVEEKSAEFINKWKERNDYLENPKVLRIALDEYEEWVEKYSNGGQVGYYWNYRYYQDQNNTDAKTKMNKIDDLARKIAVDITFFTLKLSKISKEKQKEFLNNEELKDYKHFLERCFLESKYLLSEEGEKIMTLKSDTSYSNWVMMLEEFLNKEEREIEMTDGSKKKVNYEVIMGLMDSQNKKIRDSAAKAFNDIVEKLSDLAERELNSVLSHKKSEDLIRNVERADTLRHLSDDVDSEVVDALVDAVTSRFDISKRYYELKSKLLGLPKLEYHERNVEYGKIEKEYPYKEAANLVYKVFMGIDSEFGEIFKEFVERGHMDVYPKVGKHGGAFCSEGSKTNPIFILLNHNNKLRDVLTIAHESGHGVNHFLMNKNQNALNTSNSTFTAETASTFMEDFVLEEILKEADDELRLSIMAQKLNDLVSTIFRQIACYNLETELHKEFREKSYLSKEEIGKIFLKNMSAYMGDFVELSKGSENWWVYWSHIRYFFYVYSYSGGLLISKSMQKFLKQDKNFISKIKEFLSAGSSKSPREIFSNMGIDITDKNFWLSGINEIENLLNETEKLARQLGKIK